MDNVGTVERVKALRSEGLTPKEISRAVGMRRSDVDRIVRDIASELHPRHEGTALDGVCGLCGKSDNLIRTECCDRLICNDSDQYKLFSFQRNSCYRNHQRYTLCGYHFANDHSGNWKTCKECKDSFDYPQYVDFGTNDSNFEKLNVDRNVSIQCFHCKENFQGMDHMSMKTSKGYLCEKCAPNMQAALRLMGNN